MICVEDAQNVLVDVLDVHEEVWICMLATIWIGRLCIDCHPSTLWPLIVLSHCATSGSQRIACVPLLHDNWHWGWIGAFALVWLWPVMVAPWFGFGLDL